MPKQNSLCLLSVNLVDLLVLFWLWKQFRFVLSFITKKENWFGNIYTCPLIDFTWLVCTCIIWSDFKRVAFHHRPPTVLCCFISYLFQNITNFPIEMKMCLSVRNAVLNALSVYFQNCLCLSMLVQWDCMLSALFKLTKLTIWMWVTINNILTFASPHCVSMTDRVLLNNSLTKLDDICREMPRLNWLWVMYHVNIYISKGGLDWNLKPSGWIYHECLSACALCDLGI